MQKFLWVGQCKAISLEWNGGRFDWKITLSEYIIKPHCHHGISPVTNETVVANWPPWTCPSIGTICPAICVFAERHESHMFNSIFSVEWVSQPLEEEYHFGLVICEAFSFNDRNIESFAPPDTGLLCWGYLPRKDFETRSDSGHLEILYLQSFEFEIPKLGLLPESFGPWARRISKTIWGCPWMNLVRCKLRNVLDCHSKQFCLLPICRNPSRGGCSISLWIPVAIPSQTYPPGPQKWEACSCLRATDPKPNGRPGSLQSHADIHSMLGVQERFGHLVRAHSWCTGLVHTNDKRSVISFPECVPSTPEDMRRRCSQGETKKQGGN